MVDVQFWLQLAVVLFCLAVGGRFGGVGLGAAFSVSACSRALLPCPCS